MKSRLLGLAVVLVALAVIINALALETATITNKITITVAGNGSSMIGITTATAVQDADVSVSDTNNQAVITLSDPLQAGAVYVFDAAFAVVNRSSQAIDFTVTPPAVSNGVTIAFAQSDEAGALAWTNLAAGAQAWVKMTVTTAEGVGTSTLSGANVTVNVTTP